MICLAAAIQLHPVSRPPQDLRVHGAVRPGEPRSSQARGNYAGGTWYRNFRQRVQGVGAKPAQLHVAEHRPDVALGRDAEVGHLLVLVQCKARSCLLLRRPALSASDSGFASSCAARVSVLRVRRRYRFLTETGSRPAYTARGTTLRAVSMNDAARSVLMICQQPIRVSRSRTLAIQVATPSTEIRACNE
jgi:hypothetical protein